MQIDPYDPNALIEQSVDYSEASLENPFKKSWMHPFAWDGVEY